MNRMTNSRPGPFRQRGITTLAVAIMLLVILTVGLLFAANVGFFEQRTTVAEVRAKLAQQSAESAMNLAVEYVKVNSARITSDATNGWLNSASTVKWTACTDLIAVCLAEENAARRAASYYISALPLTGTGGVLATGAAADMITKAKLSGSSTVAATSTVGALLCRFDGDDPSGENPCRLTPASNGPVAITLVTNTTIGGENAESEVKVTMATYRSIGGGADAPLIASGTVVGLGSMEVVAAPNGGGPGVPVSIWSPCPVDIEAGSYVATDPLCAPTGSGIGSVVTCHLGDYLDGLMPTMLLDTSTGCASASNVCGCPNDVDESISGHVGSDKSEGIDILDLDGNAGSNADITYFPREPLDDPANSLDDSMFEVIFNKDVVNEGSTSVRTGCSPNSDCAIQALVDMRPTELASCANMPTSTGGFYWIRNTASSGNGGNCNFPGQVGTPTDPAVVVIEGGTGSVALQGGGQKVFGMIFIRSSTTAVTVSGGANTYFVYGSLVIEGTADFTGLNLVYSDEIINRINNSPSFNRFGVVPGSWLDARTRF